MDRMLGVVVSRGTKPPRKKVGVSRSEQPRPVGLINLPSVGAAPDRSTGRASKLSLKMVEDDTSTCIGRDRHSLYRENIDAGLQLYFQEAAATPLLTLAEEVALAARIKQGDDTAREYMIKANLRLVIKIAKDYENLGVPLLDLINEGNIGLMKAVERFDPTKGAKLSTYASWWIKQAIKLALSSQGKNIRLPKGLIDRYLRIKRENNRLSAELGREPTILEIAEATDLESASVRRILKVAGIHTISLDVPLDPSGSTGDTIAEKIEDESMTDPAQSVLQAENRALVIKLVSLLPDRERRILELRFALKDGGAGKKLEEIGKLYGVTRERIRQLEEKALEKLKKAWVRHQRSTLEIASRSL